MCINELLTSEAPMDQGEQALADFASKQILGESYGYALAPRLRERPVIYGEGHIRFYGYYHSEGPRAKGAIIDAFGRLAVFVPDAQDGVEVMTFDMRSLNQVEVLLPGKVSQYFEITPIHRTYIKTDTVTQLWEDTAFQLAAALKAHRAGGPDPVIPFGKYLAERRPPLGTIVKIDYVLKQHPDQTLSYSLSNGYDSYLVVPTAHITGDAKLRQAVDQLQTQHQDRVRNPGAIEGTIELRMGHVGTVYAPTGFPNQSRPPELQEQRRRLGLPPFEATPYPMTAPAEDD